MKKYSSFNLKSSLSLSAKIQRQSMAHLFSCKIEIANLKSYLNLHDTSENISLRPFVNISNTVAK